MIGIDPQALEPLHEMIAEVGVEKLKENTDKLISLWSSYTDWRHFFAAEVEESLEKKDELWDSLEEMKGYFDRIDHEGVELIQEVLNRLNESLVMHALIEIKCKPIEPSVMTFLKGMEELCKMIIEDEELERED